MWKSAGLVLFGVLSLAACGSDQSLVSTVSDSSPIALKPDLSFVAGSVWSSPSPLLTPYTSPAMSWNVVQSFPCNTAGIKVQFKYKNTGLVPAGAHKVSVGITGATTAVQSRPALSAGATATVSAIVNVAAIPANADKLIWLQVDSASAVTESSEFNNLFRAYIRKVCP